MGWYERWAQWSERYRFRVDLGWTLLAAAVTIPGMLTFSSDASMVAYDPVTTLIAAVIVLVPLPWARTRPLLSAVAMFTVCMVQVWVLRVPFVAPDLLVLVSVYCVTVYGTRRAYLTAAVLGVVGSVAFGLSTTFTVESLFVMVPTLALVAASFAFGLVRRSRRAMLQAMRDRTERLEIERDQQARIATAAERARIAREMHDIVAHSLSVMIAQADGGRYAAAADPAAAQRALGTIAETGRAALADMRRLLGVLREDEPAPATPLGLVAPDGAAGGTRPARDAVPAGTAAASSGAAPAAPAGAGATAAAAAPLRPQPDAADIGHLVEQAKDGGMRVSWARVGVERRLPPGVGLTLYRVCQEALTNVRKHAGPRPAVTVLVRWGEDEVELRVDDDGRGLAADAAGPDEPAPSPGYGLLGMRERAEMFGGTLSAGPRQGGGFSVRFVVPIPRAAAPAAVPDPVPDPVPAGAVEAEGGVGSGPTGAAGSPTDSGPERAPEPDSPTEPDSGPGADADDADSPGPTDLQDTRGAR